MTTNSLLNVLSLKCPQAVLEELTKWAVDHTSLKFWREIRAGGTELYEPWRTSAFKRWSGSLGVCKEDRKETSREVRGKPGEHAVTEAKRRPLSKENDLSVSSDAAERSSNCYLGRQISVEQKVRGQRGEWELRRWLRQLLHREAWLWRRDETQGLGREEWCMKLYFKPLSSCERFGFG